MYTTPQVIAALKQNIQLATSLAARCAEVRTEAARLRALVETERGPVLLALAAAWLPDLSGPTLEAIPERTGFSLFRKRDPRKVIEHEEAALRKRILSIQADERYVRRTYLVGPYGELTRALDEAKSLLDPWEQACAVYEVHEGFTELIETRYDTPEFQVRWWEPRYWRLWAAGDRITEALGHKDFGDDVLPRWREVEGHRQRWRDQVAQAQAKVDAVHALAKEHDDAQHRLANLPALVLEDSQRLLAEYLKEADPSLLASWNDARPTPDPAITMGLRRAAGLSAKLAIFDEIESQGFRELEVGLTQRVTQWRMKIVKLQRPKKAYLTWGENEVAPGFAEKAEKTKVMLDKAWKAMGRVSAFDDYESFDLENDPNLWYSAFTGGPPPARLLPETRSWYDRNPNVQILRDTPDVATPLLAAALLARDTHDQGYLS
jgi:hypothetical protein